MSGQRPDLGGRPPEHIPLREALALCGVRHTPYKTNLNGQHRYLYEAPGGAALAGTSFDGFSVLRAFGFWSPFSGCPDCRGTGQGGCLCSDDGLAPETWLAEHRDEASEARKLLGRVS